MGLVCADPVEACAKSRIGMEACADSRQQGIKTERKWSGVSRESPAQYPSKPQRPAFETVGAYPAELMSEPGSSAAMTREYTDETFISLARDGPQPETSRSKSSVAHEPQTRAMKRWSERERGGASAATDMEKVNLRLQVRDLQHQLEQQEQKLQAMRAKTSPVRSSTPLPSIVPVMTKEGSAAYTAARRPASPEHVRHHHAGQRHNHHHHCADPASADPEDTASMVSVRESCLTCL